VIPIPAYAEYGRACALAEITVDQMLLEPENDFCPDMDLLADRLHGPSLVFAGHPANPAGTGLDVPALRRLARSRPDCFFVVDEAYADLSLNLPRVLPDIPKNVLVLWSLTKCLAVPGLRLGFALGDQAVISRLRDRLPPWSVNAPAQAVGLRAMEDFSHVEQSARAVEPLRQTLASDLSALGLEVFSSKANYLLCRLKPSHPSAEELAGKLFTRRILIRDCSTIPGLDSRFIRVAVKRAEENAVLTDALARETGRLRPRKNPGPRRPSALMIQGTCSNAGKSLLAAGICRALCREGWKVAPFKAQNMSLNSGVTADGLEMGRAQILQARACGLEPDVRMNPVLLKPGSDNGSQVIVLGRPQKTMKAGEYFQAKAGLWETVRRAYDDLATEFQIMVLEGAGSPAEVNLKAHDIVNMAMARHAQARVLLAADIDRGGAFASILGTWHCLDFWEQDLLSGFVLNKFRGDPSLLGSGPDFITERTGLPCLGLMPHLPDLHLPDEDSVSFKNSSGSKVQSVKDKLTIVCLDLPRISNATDLDSLRLEPDVVLAPVSSTAQLTDLQPDAVVIPGSKAVAADLDFLRRSGLADLLVRLARKGTEIVGVCGGYQILGLDILDPHALESGQGRVPGLGLLNLRTSLGRDKTLRQVTAAHLPSGLDMTGYEIHHGQTEAGPGPDRAVPVIADGDRLLGHAHPKLPLWGTYVHGLFDAAKFRRWWLNTLRSRKGLAPLHAAGDAPDLDTALNRLADAIVTHLDWTAVTNLVKRRP
jgi:cobyric acid synthase CobQ